jgi:hypothetical protein
MDLRVDPHSIPFLHVTEHVQLISVLLTIARIALYAVESTSLRFVGRLNCRIVSACVEWP